MDDIHDFEQRQNQQQRELSKSCAAHTELGKYIHPKYQNPAWTKQLDPNFVAQEPDTNYSLYDDQGLPKGIDWDKFLKDQKAKEAARPVNKNFRPTPFTIEPVLITEEEQNKRSELKARLHARRTQTQD